MKKGIVTAIVLLMTFFWAIPSKAQKLVLHHADKTTTDVELYLQPRVTFQGDKLLIASTIINMEFSNDNVLRFTYERSSMGISKPKGNVDYSRENGKLVFHGIEGAKKIAVYTLDGIRVPIKTTLTGNDVIIPISAIPSGVYMLSVNGKTSKFTKK